MRVVTLTQGSDAWKLYRMEHANASEAGALMGCAPKWMQIHTPYQLFQYKQGELEYEESAFVKGMQQHGHDMEEMAREFVSKSVGISLSPAVFEEDIVDISYSASLDGYGESSGEPFSVKAEIKCPATGRDSAVWRAAVDGEIPSYYYWQVVHQELVCPTTKTYFCVYISDDASIIIDLDEAMPGWRADAERLQEEWGNFFAEPPAPDWLETKENTEWAILERDFLVIRAEIEEKELALKATKARMIEITEAAEVDRARGDVVEVSRRHRKGAIDYKKALEGSGIKTEPFRKKGSSYWDVRERK